MFKMYKIHVEWFANVPIVGEWLEETIFTFVAAPKAS